jgi:hypothetical protein
MRHSTAWKMPRLDSFLAQAENETGKIGFVMEEDFGSQRGENVVRAGVHVGNCGLFWLLPAAALYDD